MLHSEATHELPNYDRDSRVVQTMQLALEDLCLQWRIPAPKYKYRRRSIAQGYVTGLHATVLVNEVEYSSPLASTDWHPGWGSYNDAREAVACEVLRALGVIPEESDQDE